MELDNNYWKNCFDALYDNVQLDSYPFKKGEEVTKEMKDVWFKAQMQFLENFFAYKKKCENPPPYWSKMVELVANHEGWIGEDDDGSEIFMLNANDVFYPAADGEDVTIDEIDEVHSMWKENKDYGTLIWMMKKRNLQPRKKAVERMKQEGVWEEWMENLDESKF